MKDPVNPTRDEIEQWARTPGAMYPMEDWDLVIASEDYGDLLLRLAADPTCVNRDAALNFLYVYAGQVVREGGREDRVAALRTIVDRAMAGGDDEIRMWARRTAAALRGSGPDPRPVGSRGDYEFWFGGRWRETIG